ncbi:MAG: hypothetical protein EZS28_031534, partial [Streblomastix strix]
MRNRTKTTDQLPRMDLRLEKDVHKDDRSKETGTTILTYEIYQPNRETSTDQDKISSINNGQVEFSKSPSKRSFGIYKVNELCKNESVQEQRMEREYDSTQENPSRTFLVAGSDSEELIDDFRSENSRSSNDIRSISERMGSDSGTINKGCFSLTWRMEQGTEPLDKQQEGDESHLLRTLPLRINLQRAANQKDPQQVRQLQFSLRFNKADIRLNNGSRSEANSQAMTTTENANTDTTYSRTIKQNKRYTKYTKHPGRLLSKERVIHSSVPSAVANFNSGLVCNRENKFVDRFVVIVEESVEAEQLNAFSRSWQKEIFWIHPPIPKNRKALNACEWFKPKSIVIAAWWPGQIWFTSLLADGSKYFILGESSLILNPGKEMMRKKYMPPPGKNRGISHKSRVEQGRKLLVEFLNNVIMARETQEMIIQGQKYNNQKKYMQT